MRYNAMAACDRHLAKGTRQVLGADITKEVKISRVSNDPMYRCFCGLAATFYLRAINEPPRSPGQPRQKQEANGGQAIPFPRKKSEW